MEVKVKLTKAAVTPKNQSLYLIDPAPDNCFIPNKLTRKLFELRRQFIHFQVAISFHMLQTRRPELR